MWHHIPEDSTPHGWRIENFKANGKIIQCHPLTLPWVILKEAFSSLLHLPISTPLVSLSTSSLFSFVHLPSNGLLQLVLDDVLIFLSFMLSKEMDMMMIMTMIRNELLEMLMDG
jgi:hypothetical protein